MPKRDSMQILSTIIDERITRLLEEKINDKLDDLVITKMKADNPEIRGHMEASVEKAFLTYMDGEMINLIEKRLDQLEKRLIEHINEQTQARYEHIREYLMKELPKETLREMFKYGYSTPIPASQPLTFTKSPPSSNPDDSLIDL